MADDEASAGPRWSLEEDALTAADTVYHSNLESIDVSPFTQGLVGIDQDHQPLLPNREDREIYSDTLYDLHRLLEEVRFEIATAVMLLVDFRVRRGRGEIPSPEQPDFPVRLSIELVVTLAPFIATPPTPSTLAVDLHQQMSGERHLSLDPPVNASV